MMEESVGHHRSPEPLICSADVQSLATRKVSVREARKTICHLQTSSIYVTILGCIATLHRLSYRKDCPQRNVVSRQSSLKLTGSLHHCELYMDTIDALSVSKHGAPSSPRAMMQLARNAKVPSVLLNLQRLLPV